MKRSSSLKHLIHTWMLRDKKKKYPKHALTLALLHMLALFLGESSTFTGTGHATQVQYKVLGSYSSFKMVSWQGPSQF